MTPEAERAWRFVVRSPARYFETIASDGFRALCDSGWLRELPSENGRYKFELAQQGYVRAMQERGLLATN